MTDIDHKDLIAEAERMILIDRISHEPVVATLARVTTALEVSQARLREAEELIGEIRANAVELLDADDDSYDGSLSAIWAVELIDAYETTKTENGSER